MIILVEFIILLTSIGTNKVRYLERINVSDCQICNMYFTCIEKYILIESEEITNSKNVLLFKAKDNNLNSSKVLDSDKKSLIELVKEQEKQIHSYEEQIKELKKEKENLENNLKEKEVIIEKKQNITKEMANGLFNNILFNQLKTEDKKKDISIDSQKSQNNYIQKKQKEKLYNLEEELINFKNNMKNKKEVQDKYEQLMIKYKNLKKNLQENNKKYNLPSKIQLLNDFEDLKQKNEFLLKENDLLKNEINKLNQNTLIDKEKIKQLEIENKKINYEKNKLKNINNKKEEKNINKGISLDKIIEEDKENKINGIKIRMEDLLFENENLKSKIKSINQEKQKISMDLQKIELDNKKLLLTIDKVKNESKRYYDDNKFLNEKLIEINKLKKKDFNKLKKEIDDKTNIIGKMLQEKKEMIKNYEILQKELEQNKNNNENKKHIGNYNNIIKEKEIIISNSENLDLKNEIQNLNLMLLQKDEEIKKLKDERQLTDDEVNLKLADLDFYKKLYEEQKVRVNKEHELISDSLYKLAIHFMSLKDDLKKKIKNK